MTTEPSFVVRGGAKDGLAWIAQALFSSDEFQDCSVASPYPHWAQLCRGPLLVIVAEGPEWEQIRPQLGPYEEQFDKGDAALIVLGAPSGAQLEPLFERQTVALLDRHPSPRQLQIAVRSALTLLSGRTHAELQGKWLDQYRYELGELVNIARLLSTERELDKLLGLILEKARYITGADAGSLYVVEGSSEKRSERVLRFKLTQNDSVSLDWSEYTIPISARSIAGITALERRTVNIADVYELPPGTPFTVDRSFDRRTGYRTRSMLCVPLVNKAEEVIGVLQIINKKKDPSRPLGEPQDYIHQVIPFDAKSQELLEALAAQAGISLENALLYEEIRSLFEGFVHASVEAIEQRDPTTSGHSLRVAQLSVALAQEVSRTDSGPYGAVQFSTQDLRELEYASLLHDFGKIGVREQVLVKAKKLYPGELERIRARLDYALRAYESDVLRRKVRALQAGANEQALGELDTELRYYHDTLEGAWQTIVACNEPTILAEGEFSRIDSLVRMLYRAEDGSMRPVLTESEAQNLKIPRGSLNPSEIDEIRSHVVHTYRFLSRIPWGKTFGKIPLIAGAHHERIDGTGYPNHLKDDQIPLQSRIMSVADIFDALTASDRPYKRAVAPETALRILDAEAKENHLDAELVRIFREAKVWESVLPVQGM